MQMSLVESNQKIIVMYASMIEMTVCY